MYFLVKHIHLTAIFLSVSFFILRFVWLLRSSPMLQAKWVKILPHVVDTVLLISAATLCVLIGQYPMIDTWLTQKLLFVILYILMGFVTLKWAHTTALRWLGFIGALACIMFAAKIAVLKQGLFFS
jgi:uncharacterized membrane protein SirB2